MISFIIIAQNQERNIARCINSLQRIKGKKEIILVDDGSEDKTVEMAEIAGANIIIENKVQKGISISRNLGLEAARGEYFSIIDADIEVVSFPASLIECEFNQHQTLIGVIGKYESLTDGFERALDIRRNVYYLKNNIEFEFGLEDYTTVSGGFSVYRKDLIADLFENNNQVASEDLLCSLLLLSKNPKYYFKYIPSFSGIHYHERNLKNMWRKDISEAKGYVWLSNRVQDLPVAMPTLKGLGESSILTFVSIITLNPIVISLAIIIDISKFAIPLALYRDLQFFRFQNVAFLVLYSYIQSLLIIYYHIKFVFFEKETLRRKLNMITNLFMNGFMFYLPRLDKSYYARESRKACI